MTRERRILRVHGQVQGVGFRPFVVRVARELGLVGGVCNAPHGVHIEAEGPVECLDALASRLEGAPPPIQVQRMETERGELGGGLSFELRPSVLGGSARPVLPPDHATCPTCLAEHDDPDDRRYGYALLSCTTCGPRYTIATALPFDRERTVLSRFPLCTACEAEYTDPSNRRFHAQTTGCPACGPRLGSRISEAAEVLLQGGLLALQGLGGFQLLCDATNPDAVARLRTLKHRPHKPLAVLMDPDALGRQGALLHSPAAPIVLVPTPAGLADVSDGLPWTGVMRPPTAMHLQLARAVGRPLVCTSGNLSGQPLWREASEVSGADAVLAHDRPIVRALDDSVVRVVDGEPLLIRRARGFAPSAIPLEHPGPTVLALGAHLKSTLALSLGDRAVLSPHIGDLGTRGMLERFDEEIDALLHLFGSEPTRIACDLHPDYPSTRRAEQLAAERGVPLVRVQHHEAHLAAVIAEHHLNGPVLGVVWDGAGYGHDGTTWGAEALTWDGASFRRVPMIPASPLPGGDACARSPARCAIGVFGRRPGAEAIVQRASDALPAGAGAVLKTGVERGLFPMATSMGRLFDAIAFLCGAPAHTTYEAAAAMYLEALAMDALPAVRGGWPPEALIPAALEDWRAGVSPPTMAARFHLGLVERIVVQARQEAVEDVALSGGCFQNAVLLGLARRRLADEGFRVHVPRKVPPNDGAIALGQLWLARRGA